MSAILLPGLIALAGVITIVITEKKTKLGWIPVKKDNKKKFK